MLILTGRDWPAYLYTLKPSSEADDRNTSIDAFACTLYVGTTMLIPNTTVSTGVARGCNTPAGRASENSKTGGASPT